MHIASIVLREGIWLADTLFSNGGTKLRRTIPSRKQNTLYLQSIIFNDTNSITNTKILFASLQLEESRRYSHIKHK